MSLKIKTQYFLASLTKRWRAQGNNCPSCGSPAAEIVEQKFLITDLRRCQDCDLLFRTPTTTESENLKFYQETYQQGFTTDCPSDEQLQQLCATQFANTSKDYSEYINILKTIGAKPGQRLLDYGCSWGYGSWQFKQAGFEVTSFEISKPRCRYAREKLGIDAKDSLTDVQAEFDIIFSCHVIEHLPVISKFLSYAESHLHPGGLLVTLCPNGSEQFRASNPQAYSKIWGLVHPQILDEKFYLKHFGKSKLLMTTSPYDLAVFHTWDKNSLYVGNLSGNELLSVWLKPSAMNCL